MLLHFTNPLCQKKMVTYKIKRQDIIKDKTQVLCYTILVCGHEQHINQFQSYGFKF